MNNIEFSILISAYNAEEYLAESIASALNQKSVKHEVLVMNDGSSDSTINILKGFNDPRLRVFSRENRGKARSINELADLACGEFVAIQDADDLSTKNRLHEAKKVFKSKPDLDAIMSGHSLIINDTICTPNGEDMGWKQCRELVHQLRLPAHDPTIICKKNILLSNPLNDKLPIAQGVDLVFRLAEKHKIAVIEKQLYLYRIHMNSITKKKKSSKKAHLKQVLTSAHERQKKSGLNLCEVANVPALKLESDALNNLFGTFTSSVKHSLKRRNYQEAIRTALISLRYLSYGPRYAKPLAMLFLYPILHRLKKPTSNMISK